MNIIKLQVVRKLRNIGILVALSYPGQFLDRWGICHKIIDMKRIVIGVTLYIIIVLLLFANAVYS
ncbi:MAG: hypothetical protein JSW20_08185 [Nitrospiraceae bacterium]|nr:MAG: hypothetical protein JSW20_08185 [Nitrospiraceae bacterium]